VNTVAEIKSAIDHLSVEERCELEILMNPLESDARYPLRGTPVTLLDSTAPVAATDWETTSCSSPQ
jgi:hypothetical protein